MRRRKNGHDGLSPHNAFKRLWKGGLEAFPTHSQIPQQEAEGTCPLDSDKKSLCGCQKKSSDKVWKSAHGHVAEPGMLTIEAQGRAKVLEAEDDT